MGRIPPGGKPWPPVRNGLADGSALPDADHDAARRSRRGRRHPDRPRLRAGWLSESRGLPGPVAGGCAVVRRIAPLTAPLLMTATLAALSLFSAEFLPGFVTASDGVTPLLLGLVFGPVGGLV